ncbi:hypothetical protein [Saccharibacillus sacchari]|uniref:Uncharacterized protein n=1 Tax=Saccharibacillus sacchari TaxID=456493 RepID=A0ACC6PHM3_9BACL
MNVSRIKKPFLVAAALALLLTGLPYDRAHAEASLRTRAEIAYFTDVDSIKLHRLGSDFTPEEAQKATSYDSRYIPVKDLFGGQVEAIRWNAAAKTVSIVNKGKTAILNFSGKKIAAKQGEIVLPATWSKMENSKALIDIYTLTYVLDRYGDAFDDAERTAWSEKLDFLGIQYAETLPVIRSSDVQIYVTFEEK